MRLFLSIVFLFFIYLGHAQDSLYTSVEDPGTITNYSTDGPAEIGVVFKVSALGAIQVVRYYTSTSGNYSATLWNDLNKKVDTISFTSNGRGWQRIFFSNYMAVDTGKLYTVSITVPKNYDSRSQAFKTPIVKGNLTGIKGVHTNFPGTLPTRVYDNVSYYITPVFEAVHPLVVRTEFSDTTLRYPIDSIELRGSVSGDNVNWSWSQLVIDSIVGPNSSFKSIFYSNTPNSWVKKMKYQYYTFLLSAKDKWGNTDQKMVNIRVIQPLMILLSDKTWITAEDIYITDLREYFDEQPPL